MPINFDIPPPQLGNVPQELQTRPQWVCWRLEPRPGEEKPTKVPYSPESGDKARAGQPGTWSTFEEAVRAYQASQDQPRPYSGIGFELSEEDGLFGGDIDGCIDPATGEVLPAALDIVALADTYTEVSPSGTGLRFFGLGTLPPGRRKQGPLELYDRGRFLTITGRRLGNAPPSVADRSEVLPALHAMMFPPQPEARKPKKSTVSSLTAANRGTASDGDLLSLASRAANGAKFDALWRGDTSAYGGDDSAADLALCCMIAFYTGPDAGRIASLFGQSALGQRPKWDREDYQARTIGAALAGMTEFYKPPGVRILERGLQSAEAATPKTRDAAPEGIPFQEIRDQEDRDEENQNREKKGGAGKVKTAELALTDIGNGQRLAERHGRELHFCHAWDKWLVWDGQRWCKDDTGEIDRRAKETAQHIYREAADCENVPQQAELAKHALRSQSHARLQSMIALATSEPGIPARVSDWDKTPWLLACSNGTVDLRNGRLLKSRRSDMNTKKAGTAYDPESFAPRWKAFLETVLPDAAVRAFFQRAAGYALTGDVSEQCLFFLYGSGSNGKSTALGAVMSMMGDYALQAAPDLLIARENGGGPNNDVAELQGTRLVATIEVEDGKRMAEGLVKQITGGDRIKARYMRQDYFEFDPSHKIFLAANHKPTIRGQDYAIWRRIKVIPFEVQIEKAHKDPDLPNKLKEELPGILAWAVRGCLDWQQGGLAEPSAVEAATEHYRGEQDALADFLTDCCVLQPGLKATAAALYGSYREWAEENGDRLLGRVTFGKRLQEGRRIFPITGLGPSAARGWEGIGLKDTRSEAAFEKNFVVADTNDSPATGARLSNESAANTGTLKTDVSDNTDVSDPKIPIAAQRIETRDNNRNFMSETSERQNQNQIQNNQNETEILL